jgi:hypothetical protein
MYQIVFLKLRVLSLKSPISLSPSFDLALSLSPSSFALAPSPIEPASSLGHARFTLTLGLVFVLAFSPTELATSSRTPSQLD